MFRWDILTNWRVQGSLFANCYWDRDFIFGAIWVCHDYCSWFCTWSACVYRCLPIISSSRWKVAFIGNSISRVWCSSMIYSNWFSLWIIIIRLWLNLNCYRNFILSAIWVSHYYCSWFCTWCACIDWCLPVIGSSWRKCPLVSNTIFSIWCSAMIYRNWLSLWIIVICLWLNLNSHRYFVNCTIIISNNHCCRFITWSRRIWCSTLPCVSRISWKVTLIGDTRSGTWSISMFCWDIFTNRCVVV